MLCSNLFCVSSSSSSPTSTCYSEVSNKPQYASHTWPPFAYKTVESPLVSEYGLFSLTTALPSSSRLAFSIHSPLVSWCVHTLLGSDCLDSNSDIKLNIINTNHQLYTAFKLVQQDFTEGPLREAPMWKPLLAMALIAVGMVAMAVIGKWA